MPARYRRDRFGDRFKDGIFVPIEWAETVPEDNAVDEPSLFGNRNRVCAPSIPQWQTTIERLQQAFSQYDAVGL